jgi:hypothetical protein
MTVEKRVAPPEQQAPSHSHVQLAIQLLIHPIERSITVTCHENFTREAESDTGSAISLQLN